MFTNSLGIEIYDIFLHIKDTNQKSIMRTLIKKFIHFQKLCEILILLYLKNTISNSNKIDCYVI